jgi:quercetin dioxygenase-like cupin family protein
MAPLKNAKYIVTELKAPEMSPGFAAEYAKWATRILWLDNKIVPGASNLMCSWYLRPPPKPLEAHTHDYAEIIGFLGSNPEDPYDLGGEIEFWLEDEKYTLTRSCFIWVPGGMKHCPMVIKRVDRPILHLGSSVK